MNNVFALGRKFFALAVVASGIQQLVRADFVRVVPKLPAWIPWPAFWAVAVGLVLIAAGSAILVGFKERRAALALAALLLLTFLTQRVPEVVSNPMVGFMWTNPSKVLALWGGAITLAAMADGDAAGWGWLANLRPLGPVLLAVFLVICGVQHFIYADFVDTLVPAWLPRARVWTCFAGGCLVAGGLGILIPRTARWAAVLAGVMIFLWVLLLHIPRAIALAQDPGETSAIFEALALSGVAFLVAGLRTAKS
jgi:uncharacterized membrane protein